MMGADFHETEAQLDENRRSGQPHVGIGQNTSIHRVIIDKNARIGKHVVIHSHDAFRRDVTVRQSTRRMRYR
jgi:ADP-glucose pyrophosphorylase